MLEVLIYGPIIVAAWLLGLTAIITALVSIWSLFRRY